jgi:hypothetical protein
VDIQLLTAGPQFVEKERSRPSRSLLVRSGRFALG